MEKEIQELLAVLTLYRSNFQNLHWNSAGENFDNSHKEITTDYYEMVNDTIDQIAEIASMNDILPLNLMQYMELLQNAENEYMVIETNRMYCRKEIIDISNVMLGDIVKLLITLHASEGVNTPVNIGVKSDIEAIISKFDLQYRYINRRKMYCECE